MPVEWAVSMRYSHYIKDSGDFSTPILTTPGIKGKWQWQACTGTAAARDSLELKPLGPCLAEIRPSVPWILVDLTPEVSCHPLPLWYGHWCPWQGLEPHDTMLNFLWGCPGAWTLVLKLGRWALYQLNCLPSLSVCCSIGRFPLTFTVSVQKLERNRRRKWSYHSPECKIGQESGSAGVHPAVLGGHEGKQGPTLKPELRRLKPNGKGRGTQNPLWEWVGVSDGLATED